MKVGEYEVDTSKLLTETEHAHIYLAQKGEKTVIFKIAKTFDDNEALMAEAHNFEFFMNAIEFSEEHRIEERKKSPSKYDLLFTKLEETFLAETQYDRRVNILSVRDADINEFALLTDLQSRVKIDLRTSAWVMGRLLKWILFHDALHRMSIEAHRDESDIAYREWIDFDPKDWLICPNQNRLVRFSGNVTSCDEFRDVVKKMADFVYNWTEAEKPSKNEADYIRFLKELKNRGWYDWFWTKRFWKKEATVEELEEKYSELDFEETHDKFYEIVSATWGISYYPFTYREINSNTWEKKENPIMQL